MSEFNSSLGHIALITDKTASQNNDLHKLLSLTHIVRSYSLDETEKTDFKGALFFAIDIDLSNQHNLKIISSFVGLANRAEVPTLFILDKYSRRDTVQIFSLGGIDYLVRPLNYEKLKPFVFKHAKAASTKSWKNLPPVQVMALKHSLMAFDQMTIDAAQGKPLNIKELQESSKFIIEATTSNNLATWISTLENHHNRSFSHSLIVCGYFVGFAHELGIKSGDLQKVALAGLVHDIGKSKIPLEILDKPGRLNEEEKKEMRKHSALGRDILESSSSEWDDTILDAVLHHHEVLDGTGYPDRLKGKEISNMTLLLTIADIFTALTEKRSYKKSMSAKEAYDIMLGLNGKLDEGLLRAFKPIALMPEKKLAA